MKTLSYVNFIISILFMACYAYQAVYLVAALLKKQKVFKAKKLHRYGVLIACLLYTSIFLCPFVFSILTPDLSVRALAAQALRIGLLAEPLYGVSIVAAGALRGTGDTFVPSMMNLGSIWVVRIGLALLLVGNFGLPGMRCV